MTTYLYKRYTYPNLQTLSSGQRTCCQKDSSSHRCPPYTHHVTSRRSQRQTTNTSCVELYICKLW